MASARVTLSDLVVVDLRELRSSDLEPLLVDQGAFWKSEFRWDFGVSQKTIARFLDGRNLHGYALVSRGSPVGYCYFIADSGKALIGDLYVMEAFRDRDAERSLFIRTLEAAAAFPGVRRVEGQLLGIGSEIGPEFVFQRSIEVFPRWFMLREGLRGFAAPPGDVEGYGISPWGEHHANSAAELIATAYYRHDDARINDQYQTFAGAKRFIANTTRHPGCGAFVKQASWVAFRPNSIRLSGMCLATQVDTDAGHITQICVAPEDRGKGIGYELLRRTLASLRARGCEIASLTVTASNRSAMALYERLGYWPRRRFPAFVWEGR